MGTLQCIDKYANLFIKDAYEVLTDEIFGHDLYTPHLLENGAKYIGHVVIPGDKFKRVQVDNKLSGVKESFEQIKN